MGDKQKTELRKKNKFCKKNFKEKIGCKIMIYSSSQLLT